MEKISDVTLGIQCCAHGSWRECIASESLAFAQTTKQISANYGTRWLRWWRFWVVLGNSRFKSRLEHRLFWLKFFVIDFSRSRKCSVLRYTIVISFHSLRKSFTGFHSFNSIVKLTTNKYFDEYQACRFCCEKLSGKFHFPSYLPCNSFLLEAKLNFLTGIPKDTGFSGYTYTWMSVIDKSGVKKFSHFFP